MENNLAKSFTSPQGRQSIGGLIIIALEMEPSIGRTIAMDINILKFRRDIPMFYFSPQLLYDQFSLQLI